MTKKEFRKRDPFLKREKQKYDRPVPSREYILDLLDAASQPLTRDYFVRYFKLDEEEQEAIRRRLNAMLRDGQISRTRKGYIKASLVANFQGKLSIEREGQGKVLSESGKVFVPVREDAGLFNGDEVEVAITGYDRLGRMTGEVMHLITPVQPKCVARIVKELNVLLARPIDKKIARDILLTELPNEPLEPDQIVWVEILRDEIQSENALYPGRVIEQLGEPTSAGIEIEIAKRKFDLPTDWPDEVKALCKKLPKNIPRTATRNRVDLRHLNFVTIDGEDAKDFDDAVYCEPRKPKGWRLYVAIADVSYYVKPRSALDEEARERGTSVYFPGHVIPMLPEALSNELCSLKPNEDRLALVCEMCIQPDGKITRSKFYEAVFCSKARLTYNQVGNYINGKGEFGPVGERKKEIDSLYALYQALLKQRRQRGAIDFDMAEPQILFNRSGKIKQIVPLSRNDAHRLIEECMLAANMAAAKFLLKCEHPTLFRVHEPPPHDRLTALREFLAEFGLSLGRHENPTAKDFQKLLESIEGREDAHVIQTVMLRSLSQARYSPENVGHFGLSYEAYLHFTSPIRRYPDLMVHRAIKKALNGQVLPNTKHLESLGDHCSGMERRADDATRDAIMSLKCEYMKEKEGEIFTGTISSVVPFGLFVELKDVYVEGLVHVTSLGQDYFIYDAKRHRMVGDRTRAMYKLGDKVQVKVERVGIEDQKIDLTLIHSKQKKSKKAGAKEATQAVVAPAKKRKKTRKTKKAVSENTTKTTKKRRGRQKTCRKKK